MMVRVATTVGPAVDDPTAVAVVGSGASAVGASSNNGTTRRSRGNDAADNGSAMDDDHDDDGSSADAIDRAPLLPPRLSSFADERRRISSTAHGRGWWAGREPGPGPEPEPEPGRGRGLTMTNALPPRILLLALYLMFTLSTFWILDSIKEPTLALLVRNNELAKHQPRAKMVSFVVVVALALVMEAIVRGGRRRRRHRRRGQQQHMQTHQRLLPRLRHRAADANAALEKSWEDRNLPSCMKDGIDRPDCTAEYASGGGWRRMGTSTSRQFRDRWNRLRDWAGRGGAGGGCGGAHRDFEDESDDDDDVGGGDDDDMGDPASSPPSKISTAAFFVVGIVYIKAFVAVALALRHHPSFRSSSLTMSDMDSSSSSSSSWYTALGYAFFALVESYGSVSITLFWSFANSHLTLEAAERHYGSTVALAQAGAIGGSTLVAVLGRRRGGNADDGPAVEVAADAIVGIAAAHEGAAAVGGNIVFGDTGGNVTPVLIFLACGCIGAGLAVMALYSRLFATAMVHHRPPSMMTTTRIVARYDVDDAVQVNGGANNDAYVVRGIEKVDGNDDDRRRISPMALVVQPPKLDRQDDECDVGGGGVTAANVGHEENDGIFADLLGGVHMIYRHEYLQLVLAVSVLYEIALTCMHYEMNLLGLDRFGVGGVGATGGVVVDHDVGSDSAYERSGEGSPDNNRTDEGITYIQFMGWYGQTVNVLSLVLSFYAFPRLIKIYGLRITIRIFPTVLLLVTIFAFVLFPRNLYFLFVSLSICKALTYSVHDPAEEVLYMPTSDDAKFRAKFWIDVVGQRIAKATGSAINNYAGSVEEIVKYGSLPSIVSALALWVVCYQVGIQFDSLIKSGDVVGSEEEEEDRRCEREQGDLELCEGVSNSDADCEDGTGKFEMQLKEVKKHQVRRSKTPNRSLARDG